MAPVDSSVLGEVSRELAFRDVAWVAEFLGMSVSWVYKAAERGELPCRRIGSALRFVRGEIEAWAHGERRPARACVPAPGATRALGFVRHSGKGG